MEHYMSTDNPFLQRNTPTTNDVVEVNEVSEVIEAGDKPLLPEFDAPLFALQDWTVSTAKYMSEATAKFSDTIQQMADANEEYREWICSSPVKELSSEWSVSVRSVERYIAPVKQAFVEKRNIEVAELRDKGFSKAKIAQVTDIHPSTVGRILKKVAEPSVGGNATPAPVDEKEEDLTKVNRQLTKPELMTLTKLDLVALVLRIQK